MREEITEPKHWRTADERRGQRNNSWTSRRRAQDQAGLAADIVDAALTDVEAESTESEKLDSTEILSSLADQLELLEQQREQIQRLLDQAQGR
ncbi:MAG: hypothetical protein AAGD11_15010 [Planctomycetota bacterium]